MRFLGQDFEEVHRWLDACFAEFGPLHRHVRHHREGVQEARELFGEAAANAAITHILRDCRHVPTRTDYEVGYVDSLGLKKTWSTAAYIRYTDENFEDLVREQLKPTGLILWAFLSWADVQNFLSFVTRFSQEEIGGLESAWQLAFQQVNRTIQQPPTAVGFRDLSDAENVEPEVRAHMEAAREWGLQTEDLLRAGKEISVGFVRVDALTNPFVFIDYELLEDLKPELSGSDPLDVARFALPESVQFPLAAVGDASQRNITFASRQKTLSVSNVRLTSTPAGTEVSYIISANTGAVVVSDAGDHLIIRNGAHRTYLLAQLGITEIPCIYIRDQVSTPAVTAAYPTFSPAVLSQPRHPLLTDFLRPELCLQAPIRRTQKVIRISADETLIPVE